MIFSSKYGLFRGVEVGGGEMGSYKTSEYS